MTASGRPGAGTDATRVIGSLPWAGHLSGRRGAEKAVTQFAAGSGVMIWDPDRETEGDGNCGDVPCCRAPAGGRVL